MSALINDVSDSQLHIAVSLGDYNQVLQLIIQGEDIDEARTSDGKTPLMLAVLRNCATTVQILLGYDANVDINDNNGTSALKMAFNLKDAHPSIVEQFVRTVQSQTTSNSEESTTRLFTAGCTLYHAAFMKDKQLIEGLFEHGVDVNSKGYGGKTALHVAIDLDDEDTVNWLLSRGANIDALDDDACGALCRAAANGNQLIVQWLLERGADPNVKAFDYGLTPLIAVMENTCRESERYDRCAELLLQYGAVPTQKIGDYPTVFDAALDNESFYRIDLLISYVALQEMIGVSIAETIMSCKMDDHQYAVNEFKRYYEDCQRILKIKVFKSITLVDLLSDSDCKMRRYARHQKFVNVIEDYCEKRQIGDYFPYYYVALMVRVSEAEYTVKLEDRAIPIIGDLLRCDYERYYVVIRQIASYLDEYDMEQLCDV